MTIGFARFAPPSPRGGTTSGTTCTVVEAKVEGCGGDDEAEGGEAEGDVEAQEGECGGETGGETGGGQAGNDAEQLLLKEKVRAASAASRDARGGSFSMEGANLGGLSDDESGDDESGDDGRETAVDAEEGGVAGEESTSNTA